MLVLYLVPIFFIAQSKTYNNIPDSEFIFFSRAESDSTNTHHQDVTKNLEELPKTMVVTEEIITEKTEATTLITESLITEAKPTKNTGKNARKKGKKEIKHNLERAREEIPVVVTENDEVIFLPNTYVQESYRDVPPVQPPSSDDDGYLSNDDDKIKQDDDKTSEDYFYNSGRKTDVTKDIGGDPKLVTDPPAHDRDVIFIPRKNKETVEKERKKTVAAKKKKRVNCNHLQCNTTLTPICGVRKDNGKLKFRLFRNECFMDKVNCGFKYNDNKYAVISSENCLNVGAHRSELPYYYGPVMPFKPETKPDQSVLENRRSFSSRRSNTLKHDGTFCDHLCPLSCPELYEPECAVSSTGVKKVFVNHCKLDRHSCVNNVVWFKRPLSECVGADKADQRNNRAFIGWMQRIGIIDGNGKFARA